MPSVAIFLKSVIKFNSKFFFACQVTVDLVVRSIEVQVILDQ